MKKRINMQLINIALLAILVTAIGTTSLYYNLFIKQVRNDLKICAEVLKDCSYFDGELAGYDIDNPVGGEIDANTEQKIDSKLRAVKTQTQLRLTWVTADGTVLYDNDYATSELTNHLDRPEIQEAFATGEGEAIRSSETMRRDTYYYAILLDNNTVLRVSMDAHNFWSVFVSALPMIAFIIIGVLLMCVAISYILTSQLIKPIDDMVENVENNDFKSPYKELEPFSRKIRAQHADILSAAKMRQDFSASISHELKTPLTAISGYTELLEENMIEEERRVHFLREIRRNAYRLLALINDIIKISEVDQVERDYTFENVDLLDVMTECAEDLRISAKQRFIDISFSESSCVICGCKDLLKEMLENLVQNAIRYNNPGGKVSVTVHEVNGRGVCVVEDNGIGIPLADQERIFERFYRVDKSRSKETGGTGLGLAIVKHIVELHDAGIELHSEPGVGTRVTVRF